jgi:hypothetical protein
LLDLISRYPIRSSFKPGGFKAVRYNKLPLLMLQGIKELKADNDWLKQANKILGKRLDDQEMRLRNLESRIRRAAVRHLVS